MKAQLITLVAVGLLCTNARATAHHVEKWAGTGVAYTPAGKELGSYKIEVVNTELNNRVTESVTTITEADGSQRSIVQKITKNGTSWSDVSSLGTGGGACYGADTCENYIQGHDGLAYSTTMMFTSAKSSREVTFKLKNGKAVLVLRDTLTQVQ